jgi:hypothetical protein
MKLTCEYEINNRYNTFEIFLWTLQLKKFEERHNGGCEIELSLIKLLVIRYMLISTWKIKACIFDSEFHLHFCNLMDKYKK